MKKNRIFTFTVMLSFLLLFVFSSVTTSCIKDDEDEGNEPPVRNDTTLVTDSTKVVVDSTFKASQTYILGEWMSEYVGYDPMQNMNSSIRRLVYFSSDGFYDSHVQGVNGVQQDSTANYKEFEHEYGTYSFDEGKQIMTYHVEYDSLLNFFTDELEYNAGKVIQGVGVQKDYDESIWFSLEKDGKRDWIRVDNNLRSLEDHSGQLIYIMKNQQ